MSIKENWVNSDIIDNFFIYLKGVNILTPTYQYSDIYIYSLIQLFWSIQLITRCEIVWSDAIPKLYSI